MNSSPPRSETRKTSTNYIATLPLIGVATLSHRYWHRLLISISISVQHSVSNFERLILTLNVNEKCEMLEGRKSVRVAKTREGLTVVLNLYSFDPSVNHRQKNSSSIGKLSFIMLVDKSK